MQNCCVVDILCQLSMRLVRKKMTRTSMSASWRHLQCVQPAPKEHPFNAAPVLHTFLPSAWASCTCKASASAISEFSSGYKWLLKVFVRGWYQCNRRLPRNCVECIIPDSLLVTIASFYNTQSLAAGRWAAKDSSNDEALLLGNPCHVTTASCSKLLRLVNKRSAPFSR